MKMPRTILLSVVLLSNAARPVCGQSNFEQVFDSVTTEDKYDGAGCAFVDYDNDGYQDLLVANVTGNNYLYHNEKNGTFSKVTTGDIVNAGFNESYGVACADFNNDGFTDLFVANGVGSGNRNFLYQNNGDGTFTRITNGVIATTTGNFVGCAWGDYDRDGFVDILVANFSGGPSALFHNDGVKGFSRSAFSVSSDAVSAAWADINSDGLPDLCIANGYGSHQLNYVYVNLGGGKFQRLTSANFPSADEGSVAVAWGDYDNDGFPDLYIPNSGEGVKNKSELYHNNGNGTFTRILTGEIATLESNSTTAAWGDYDNDGWLDLFVGNRDGTPGQQNLLYHNNGNGTFERIIDGPFANLSITAGGCAWGDYDNDGFLDLFISTQGDSPFERNALFHNTGNENHWIEIKCEGTVANRSAIGAKVRVAATINGTSVRQLREITSGDGIGGGALVAHFGLGNATNIDELTIEWPSQAVTMRTGVRADQFITVFEPPKLEAGPGPNPGFQMTLTGAAGERYNLESTTDLVNWNSGQSIICTNRTTVFTTGALTSKILFFRVSQARP
jgi:hypothetical protein